MRIHARALAITAASLTLAGGLAFAAPAFADDTAPAAPTEEVTSSPSTPLPSEPIPAPATSPLAATPSEVSGAETPSGETAGPSEASSVAPTPPTSPTLSNSSSAKPSDSEPSTPSAAPSKGHDPVTLCHQPGTPAQQTLTVDDNAAKGHLKHGDALGECAPLPVPVEGWWLLPNGGTADNVTWPQTATPAGVIPCGVTAQVDTYPSQAALDALAADGILTLGEDYGIAQSWRFVYGGDCPVEPGPANPAATITATCGTATVTATNEGENILTASAVVYVNGNFSQALAVPAGESQTVELTFPEDSGDAVVEVRTGPAFGDEILASATVESDCIAAPPVVTPPTDTPSMTPTETPAAAAPVVEQPQQRVAALEVSDDELAQTGSDSMGTLFGAGAAVLILLLFGSALVVASRRTRQQ